MLKLFSRVEKSWIKSISYFIVAIVIMYAIMGRIGRKKHQMSEGGGQIGLRAPSIGE